MAERPRVGVGVLVWQPGTARRGAHGGGEWALPGGHLEYGESFEECAAREVLEETGLALVSPQYAYAVNSVFEASGKHYVTVFCSAEAAEGAVPQNTEPDKCEGWEWVEYDEIAERCQPLFLPLAKLLESPWRPPR